MNLVVRKQKMNKKELGIGLVETIVAIAIAIIVITALVSMSIYTLRASVQSKLLLKGTELASNQLELLRARRDTSDWTSFATELADCDTTTCYIDGGLNITGTAGTEGTGIEEIEFGFTTVNVDTNVYRINSYAKWYVGSEEKFARNHTELSNWTDLDVN